MTPVYEVDGATGRLADDSLSLGWIYRCEPFVAALVLVVLFPLVLVIGITITILSRRSPLIRHSRVGWRGTELPMLKFRTMWSKEQSRQRFMLIEEVRDSVPVRKTRRDTRINSAFALICRRFSLDELPQLYHIVRGQMSFVGPRPLTRLELDTYYGPCAAEILRLKPGMTGLWQVAGRSRLTYSQRRNLDVLLVRRASAGLYLRIVLRTIPRVVFGDDAC